jgi:putative thioredoxin
MADSPYIVDVTAQNFAEAVLATSQSTPVLVDFWADWCSPCQTLMPVLAKLVEEYQGALLLAKVNTEEERELAAQFGIRSLPTIQLFKDGQPVDQFMGALPESEIRRFLEPHLPRPSDDMVDQAQQLLRRGDGAGAQQLIEQALSEDPDNPRIQLAFARVSATLGHFDQAEQALERLPLDQQDQPETRALRAQILFDRVTEQAPAPADLQQRLQAGTADSESIYQLAAHRVMNGDYETALDQLLALMQKDRAYGEDAARKGLLAVFDILGGSGELVNRYRNRMFNLLH